MITGNMSGGTPPDRPPRSAFAVLEEIPPASMELQQRRLLAVVMAIHEECQVQESPLQFLDGCCKHLVRVGTMPALWDGKVDPVGPEIIEVLVRYARRTYGGPPK